MAGLSYSAYIVIIITGIGGAFMLVYGAFRMAHRSDMSSVGLGPDQEQYMRES
ncbi:hypothetical protein CAC42_5509 [Sphaceloma murrayae]|uniref:Uncharacterized protein n=1 Tax=Sphaceloma murrayae TaxID=2082308 RepID=A0A2K1QYG6_9PEZI|nr:hypothetical protein CAC42_5509 [Sphaceloma murrayae]